jgi:hypothetical protein
MSITAIAYHSVFLTIYVKALQQIGAKNTVGQLTDHNSESDTDQSNSASRHKPPNSTKVSRVGQPLVHPQ